MTQTLHWWVYWERGIKSNPFHFHAVFGKNNRLGLPTRKRSPSLANTGMAGTWNANGL